MATIEDTMTATTASARAFVEQHLGETIAEFPAPVRETLLDKFIHFYCEPLTQQLELVLRKRLTDDEVRFLLFAPTPAQYGFYAALLSVRAASGDEDDESEAEAWPREIRKRFLTLFYFKHARNWPLVVEFVQQDGLQILVDLFMHRDLQVRGQAIDSFVQITSNHVAFEWFEAPAGYEARLLHAKMVALASPRAGFLRQIVANLRLYEEAESGSSQDTQRLPGGTFVLLQVLAFFLSWVRKFYTQNELRLSRELLTLLGEWKQRTQSDNEEELQLARQVYEDFSRWPALEDTEVGDSDTGVSGSPQHIESVGEHSENELFSVHRVQELINKAVEANDQDCLEQAIALCSEAVAATLSVVPALLGRAKARACLAALSPTSAKDAIRLCLLDCTAVWEREPDNMDAWRLQLELFATHKMWTEGCDVLDTWHEAHRDSYLPEDGAFLTEKRAFFDEKAHEQRQQQQKAEQTKQAASRLAKERQIYELLLQRSGIHDTSKSPEPLKPANLNGESTDTTSEPPPRDILARFRSSSSKPSKPKAKPQPATDSPVASVVQTRSFVRKFVKCQRDLAEIRSLLSSSSFQDVASAFESSLPDANLILALEALATSDESEGEASRLRLLQHLMTLPRLALVLEMASSDDQHTLRNYLHKARVLLETRSSNALAA